MIIRFFLIFSYSVDLDGAEFTFVHYIQQLLKGEPLYQDPQSFPYSITIYTPLYLHIIELTCRIFSINYITDIHWIFVIGRIISYLFTILGLTYIFLFARKQLKHLPVVLFICLTYLLLITGHSYAVRPDCMKLSFFILFLYYFYEWVFESNSVKSKFFSLLFAIISVISKQDAIIYLLLIQGITLIITKEIRVVKYILNFIVYLLIMMVLLHFIYGPYCIISLFIYNLQGIANYQNSYNILIAGFNTFRLLPFYILFIYTLIYLKRKRNSRSLILFSITGILASILSTFFLFRPGSYLNYTFELIAISIYFLILFIKEAKLTSNKIILRISIYIVLIFMTNHILNIYTINFEKEKELKNKFSEYYKIREELIPLLENKNTIYNVELQHSIFIADYNVIYGQEFHLDRLIYALLGLKSESKLICVSSNNYDSLFYNGKVNYIYIKNTGKGKFIIKKYYPNYKEYKEIGNYIIYKTVSSVTNH